MLRTQIGSRIVVGGYPISWISTRDCSLGRIFRCSRRGCHRCSHRCQNWRRRRRRIHHLNLRRSRSDVDRRRGSHNRRRRQILLRRRRRRRFLVRLFHIHCSNMRNHLFVGIICQPGDEHIAHSDVNEHDDNDCGNTITAHLLVSVSHSDASLHHYPEATCSGESTSLAKASPADKISSFPPCRSKPDAITGQSGPCWRDFGALFYLALLISRVVTSIISTCNALSLCPGRLTYDSSVLARI